MSDLNLTIIEVEEKEPTDRYLKNRCIFEDKAYLIMKAIDPQGVNYEIECLFGVDRIAKVTESVDHLGNVAVEDILNIRELGK